MTEWVKVKARKFRKGIDTFVLLVDDAVAMEDYIGNKFGVWDSTLVVREALLGMSWFSTAIHVSLAISSLTIAPIGRHRSKRKIVSILLPDALSGDQIIELIWWKCVTEERAYLSQPPLVLTVTERNRLLFLAKMVSQIPRLVETVNDFFRHRIRSGYHESQGEFMSQGTMKILYDHLSTKVGSLHTPPDNILRAIVVREPIQFTIPSRGGHELNTGLRHAIVDSVITTSLTTFHPDGELRGIQTSLFMLKISTQGKSSNKNTLLSNTIHHSLSMVMDCCCCCAGSGDLKGVILECMCYEWLKIRLVTELVLPSSRGLTVIELLQLQSVNCIIGDELSWMDERLDLGKERIPTAKLTVCSNDSR
eukprot:gene5584-7127_t